MTSKVNFVKTATEPSTPDTPSAIFFQDTGTGYMQYVSSVTGEVRSLELKQREYIFPAGSAQAVSYASLGVRSLNVIGFYDASGKNVGMCYSLDASSIIVDSNVDLLGVKLIYV